MSENQTNGDQAVNKPDEAAIAAWKKDAPDGEVFEATADGELYYFRRPRRPEFKRFANGVTASRYDSLATLLADCLLWPAANVFLARIENRPSLPTVMATELDHIFGGNIEVSVKNV